MTTTQDRQDHIQGLLRLIEPSEKARAATQLKTGKGRAKWLGRLAHTIGMHPDYAHEPSKGYRDEDSLLKKLQSLGAGDQCYVVASDSELDDTFQPIEQMVRNGYDLFEHGTILSCRAGELVLFRTAWPHKHQIVHRPR